MSVLVVGLSHKSAPVSTLERAAVSGDTLGKLLHDVARLPDIAETFVISTCNRVEVYAEVGRFHGGVAGVCDLLSRYSGIPAAELTSSLYVHYEDRAVQHLLAVSSGLESMVVGEDQILGQVRTALKVAGDHGTLGRSLRDLGRLALRTGKRARAETGIDRLGLSLVSVGIELAAPHLRGGEAAGLPGQEMREKLVSNGPGRLSGLHALVVGAGAMSGLAVATAARAGAARVTVANRTRAKAERLAAGVGGTVADFADLAAATHWHESTVRRRIEELRKAGLLYFDIDFDETVLGINANVMLWLKIEPASLDAAGRTIAAHPEIPFAGATTGTTNLAASAIFRDTRELYAYLTTRLADLPGLQSVESAPIIGTFKRTARTEPA